MHRRNSLLAINTTLIEFAPNFFNGILICEIVLRIITISLIPIIFACVYRARIFHRNFRLSLAVQCSLSYIEHGGRFVTIYHQLFDGIVRDDDWVLLISDYARAMNFSYVFQMCGALAVERGVATFAWRWYERAAPSTLLVIVAIESFAIVVSVVQAHFCVRALVPLVIAVPIAMAEGGFGIAAFFFLYHHNVVLHRAVKFQSIARQFQIKENCRIMKLMTRIFFVQSGLAGANALMFAVTQIYPGSKIGYVAHALFDFQGALALAIYFPFFLVIDRAFRIQLRKIFGISCIGRFRVYETSPQVGCTAADQSNTYFEALTTSWKAALDTRDKKK